MTRAEMIHELRNKYQYPVSKGSSTAFIRKVLHRMQERKKMYQKLLN